MFNKKPNYIIEKEVTIVNDIIKKISYILKTNYGSGDCYYTVNSFNEKELKDVKEAFKNQEI